MDLSQQDRNLTEILISLDKISADDVAQLARTMQSEGIPLDQALLNTGKITRDDLGWAYSRVYELPYLHVTEDQVDRETLKLIPQEVARRYRVLPLLKIGGELTVIVDQPPPETIRKDLEALTTCTVSFCLGAPEEIAQVIEALYGGGEAHRAEETPTLASPVLPSEVVHLIQNDRTGGELLVGALRLARDRGVAEIHVDLAAQSGTIRFREGGKLTVVVEMSRAWAHALLTRLKIASGVPAETEPGARTFWTQIPLDGATCRFKTLLLESANGASAVLRFVAEGGKTPDLGDLGFEEDEIATLTGILARGRGLVLVLGGRGAQGLDVLHGMAAVDPKHRKVVAVEREAPIAPLPFLVVEVGGSNVSDWTRAVDDAVALDPDLLLIEDLLFAGVAERGVGAALRGSLVASTLPFEAADAAVGHLLRTGVPAGMLSGALAGVVQRVSLPTLCPQCRQPGDLKPEAAAALGLASGSPVMRPKGCPACGGDGFRGEISLTEIRPATPAVRDAIASGGDPVRLREAFAAAVGTRGLREKVLEALLHGDTSVTAALRVIR